MQQEDWRGHLQGLWVRSPRNRIIIMVSTGVVTILLLCGLCNTLGSLTSGILASALTSNPGPKPTTGTSSSQINNFNPTFPLPSPTVYGFPNQGATPVGSSGTPAPSPTKDPNATPTDQPTQPGGGGGGPVTFHISPTDGVLTAGQTNHISLDGPPGTPIALSIYFTNSPCVSKIVILDTTGKGSVDCAIPANLQGSTLMLDLNYNGRDRQYRLQVV